MPPSFYARLTTTHTAGRGGGGAPATISEEIELRPDGRLTRTTGGARPRSATLSPTALAHARAVLASSGVLAVDDAAWPEPDPTGPAGSCELEVVDGQSRSHVSFATTRDAGTASAAATAASSDAAGLAAFTAAVADLRSFALAALAMHTAPPASGPT